MAGSRGERVLLTGASGYLGGHVLLELRRRGYAVRALLRRASPRFEQKAAWLEARGAEVFPGDLLSSRDLRAACKGVDSLVHSAALLGAWSRQDEEQYHVNVDGTVALMRAALERELSRVVLVSSIAAVGATREPRPLTESSTWSWEDQPRLHYAKTKREAEERSLHAQRNGLPVVVVNPTAMLGRAAQAGELRGIVVAARDGKPTRLMRGGASFACVDDVARSVLAALERGVVGERYILGGVNLTWSELYESVARFHGRERRYPTWPNGLGRVLAAGATLADGLGLSRPPWAPERYRIWGWYGFADSSKAQRDLGHEVPDVESLLRRVLCEDQATVPDPTPKPVRATTPAGLDRQPT